MIIFSAGPFTGAAHSGASRQSVTTKSPLTSGIVSSEAGGHFVPEFKFSGFDAVVIKGKAKRPVYLVHEGEFELKKAGVTGKLYWTVFGKQFSYLINKRACQFILEGEYKWRQAEMVGIKMYAEIQKLKTMGYKKQRAARELRLDAKTVRKYWDMTEGEYLL